MSSKEEYFFTEQHEWAKKEGGSVLIGISDFAQKSLGDIVFVDTRSIGDTLKKGEVFGTIESVKAAEDLYLPVGGTIQAVNEELKDHPEKINSSAYDAWIIKLEGVDLSVLQTLMSYAKYEEYTASLDH